MNKTHSTYPICPDLHPATRLVHRRLSIGWPAELARITEANLNLTYGAHSRTGHAGEGVEYPTSLHIVQADLFEAELVDYQITKVAFEKVRPDGSRQVWVINPVTGFVISTWITPAGITIDPAKNNRYYTGQPNYRYSPQANRTIKTKHQPKRGK